MSHFMLKSRRALFPASTEAFAKQSADFLNNLNFDTKKAIVLNVIDKIVAAQDKLQVWGYIPVTIENNVAFITKYRNCRFAKRW